MLMETVYVHDLQAFDDRTLTVKMVTTFVSGALYGGNMGKGLMACIFMLKIIHRRYNLKWQLLDMKSIS